MTTRTRLAALALAALATLAACSSGDDGTSVAETQPEVASQPAAGAEAPGVVLVSAEQAQAVLEAQPDAVTLDVRTPEEFAAGHLADASLLDFNSGEFAARLGELPTDATYVLYCRSGNRSAQAAAMMRDAGFREVYEVDGGIQAWQAAGLPVES